MGYNLNVIFSKDHGTDYVAAINIHGYSIPGWGYLIEFLRKFNSNLAVFWGKRFAPGKSRLHVRIFESEKLWYIIPHIDTFNWIDINFRGVRKSHKSFGQGDYKNGAYFFVKSLKHYFESK